MNYTSTSDNVNKKFDECVLGSNSNNTITLMHIDQNFGRIVIGSIIFQDRKNTNFSGMSWWPQFYSKWMLVSPKPSSSSRFEICATWWWIRAKRQRANRWEQTQILWWRRECWPGQCRSPGQQMQLWFLKLKSILWHILLLKNFWLLAFGDVPSPGIALEKIVSVSLIIRT